MKNTLKESVMTHKVDFTILGWRVDAYKVSEQGYIEYHATCPSCGTTKWIIQNPRVFTPRVCGACKNLKGLVVGDEVLGRKILKHKVINRDNMLFDYYTIEHKGEIISGTKRELTTMVTKGRKKRNIPDVTVVASSQGLRVVSKGKYRGDVVVTGKRGGRTLEVSTYAVKTLALQIEDGKLIGPKPGSKIKVKDC